MIYLFGNKSNQDLGKAVSVFSKLTKIRPEDQWYLFDYGFAGISVEEEMFEKKWPDVKKRIERLHSRYGTDRYRNSKEYRKMQADYDAMESRKKKYIESIRKASRMGCDAATQFLSNYERR